MAETCCRKLINVWCSKCCVCCGDDDRCRLTDTMGWWYQEKLLVKSWYIMSTSFTKLRLFTHKVSIISTLSPPLHVMLYAICIKFLLIRRSSSRTLCISRLSSAEQYSWSASFVRPNRSNWEGVKSVLREDEGKQATLLLQLPPLYTDWCAVWHCDTRGLGSSHHLAETFGFVVLVCLMSAHVTVNWLWHFCPRIPVTRLIHCPRRC